MTTTPQPKRVVVGDDTVGYYEYGDPDGKPVLAFHGIPASGAGFDWADDPARALGLRVLAPDRPGVGLSSRAKVTQVAGYPERVAGFADTLGLAEFTVWGYSGGGPYAVACAARLADRVRHAAVAAGMGQVGVWADIADFEKTDRQLLQLAPKHPRVAGMLLSLTAFAAKRAPGIAVASFRKQVSESDRAVIDSLGSPHDALAMLTQAFLNGSAGVVADYQSLARPWDVDPAAIEIPVSVWHGDADPMVPLAHSQALVSRISNVSFTVWPGEGHLGTITHVGDILGELANAF